MASSSIEHDTPREYNFRANNNNNIISEYKIHAKIQAQEGTDSSNSHVETSDGVRNSIDYLDNQLTVVAARALQKSTVASEDFKNFEETKLEVEDIEFEDIDNNHNHLLSFNTSALDLAASKTQLPLVSAKNSNCDLNNQRNYSDDSGHESKQISTLLTASVVGAQGIIHNNTFTKNFPNNLCRRSYHDITFSSIVQDNEQPSSSVVSSGHNSHNLSNHLEQQTNLEILDNPIHSNYVSTTYLPVSNKVSFDNRKKESKDSQSNSNSMTQFNDNLTLGTLHIKDEVNNQNHNHQNNQNTNNIQDTNTQGLTEDLFVLEDEYIDNDFEEYFDGILEESKMEPNKQNEVNDNNDLGDVLTKD